MSETVQWLSAVPGFCETCDEPINEVFYDAATKAGPRDQPARPGPWACMCPKCFTKGPGFGKLGQGLGQEYKRHGPIWVKTGG
jgi:hypothetical protein